MPADKRKKGSLAGRVAALLAKLAVAFVLLSILWVLAHAVVPPPVTATMIANSGGGRGIAKDWTPLSSIDPDMARAVIAAEDSKFCSHDGFDREAIEDAWQRYRKGGRIRGGSTISQQAAKNAFLWQGGGFVRKGLEAWFTLLVENIWGKRRIMEVYLNVAETGIGTYGAEAGAQRYFRHGAGRLSAIEAARIAAVLPLPKKRGAVAPQGFTRRYGASILARMAVVRREGLDDCLGLNSDEAETTLPAKRKPAPRKARDVEAALEAVAPAPEPAEESVVDEPVPPDPVVETEPPADPPPDDLAPVEDPAP